MTKHLDVILFVPLPDGEEQIVKRLVIPAPFPEAIAWGTVVFIQTDVRYRYKLADVVRLEFLPSKWTDGGGALIF